MHRVTPEKFFLIIILVIGILLIILTPLNAGYDEETHVARIWEMSSGELIPNRLLNSGPNFPTVFYEISFRQLRNPGAISLETWHEQLTKHIDWDNMLAYEGRSVYFPSFYLVQAFIMGIMGRVLDIPVALIIYTIRISYLLLYAAIVFLTLRWLPFGKWVMGILAASPMALVQASVVTPDAVNNGLSFLFIAWVLKLAVSDANKPFSRAEWWISLAMVIAVTTLKANSIPLLLLVLLIPKSKFGSVRNRWVAFGVILLAVVSIFVGWNLLITWSDLSVPTKGSSDLSGSLVHLLRNPEAFGMAVLNSISSQLLNYYTQWVGTAGYAYWNLPTLMYVLFPLMLILAVLADAVAGKLSRRSRELMLGVFLLTSIATFAVFYLYSVDANNLIHGVQGRYFISASPLLLLSFIPNRPILLALTGWIKALTVIMVALTAVVIGLVYHVPCGSTAYTPGVCTQPQYKNWDPDVSLPVTLAATTRVEQTLSPVCNEINQVRVWINQNTLQGEVQVCLTAVETPQEQCTVIPSASITEPGWLSIQIPAFKTQINSRHQLSLTAQGSGLLTLAAFPVNEYPDHQFSVNDRLQEGTLVFQYACPGYLQTFLSAK